MKKHLLLTLAVVASLSASAQKVTTATISNGYYRIQSNASSRFFALLDSTGWYRRVGGNPDVDLFAIRTLADNDANGIASNPATVIYINSVGNSRYDCSAQGVSLEGLMNQSFLITHRNDFYQLRAEQSGGAAILSEASLPIINDRGQSAGLLADSGYVTAGSATVDASMHMNIYAVNSNTDSYFGFKPTLKVGDKYYGSCYASFPFKVVSNGVKVYGIAKVDGNKAVLLPYDNGTVIPGGTPVLIESSSNNPKDNQADPVVSSAKADLVSNMLRGVYYNYQFVPSLYVMKSSYAHNNKRAYNPATTRFLAVSSDGKLVFKKDTSLGYLPANQAYLPVDASAPDELEVMTNEEYTAGVSSVKASKSADNAVYTLGGVKVDASAPLPHGVYIIGGKKVVK